MKWVSGIFLSYGSLDRKNYCEEENNMFSEKLSCFVIHFFFNSVLSVNLGLNATLQQVFLEHESL